MKRVQLFGVGLLGILIGAGGLWAIFGRVKIRTMPPANAPVVVKGGSLRFRSAQPWQLSNNNTYAQTNVQASYLTGVSVDGFTQSNGSTQLVTESAGENTTPPDPLQNNWRVTLIFRDGTGNDPAGPDPAKPKLKICSDAGCTASGTISGGTILYLQGDGTGTFYTDNNLDGEYLLRYELNSCSVGAGEHTPCNHVKKLKIDGIGSWDSGDSVSTTVLWCFAGMCDIGFGQ